MGVPITVTDKLNPEQFEIVNANTIKNKENVPNKDHGLIKDKEGQISQKVLDKDAVVDNALSNRIESNQGLSMLVLSSARYCNGVIGVPITFLDNGSCSATSIPTPGSGTARTPTTPRAPMTCPGAWCPRRS